VLFMKGTPQMPQCGFSRAVVQILDLHDIPKNDVKAYNVLEDQELREAIKEYSSWPTIPQVYVDGEFIGGCDIVMEMHSKGELAKVHASRSLAAGLGSNCAPRSFSTSRGRRPTRSRQAPSSCKISPAQWQCERSAVYKEARLHIVGDGFVPVLDLLDDLLLLLQQRNHVLELLPLQLSDLLVNRGRLRGLVRLEVLRSSEAPLGPCTD
jgi:Grx4 family monothiol glutaredoxin